jgi:hypothetical protein
MKLPAIQFNPGDWHKDQGVQALDLAHRGAWFELLLMMHDSDERGVLLVNGQPMPDAVIARRLGLDNQSANQILTTLITYGVASRRESDGALFCRRMVKDENLRRVRTAAGKKGGNPRLLNQAANQKPTTGDKQIPTPSSSSSISSSSSNNKEEVAMQSPPNASTPQEYLNESESLIAELKANPAYAQINVEIEAAKMFQWCKANGKQPTRRRLVNWLNRAEKPLSPPRKATPGEF